MATNINIPVPDELHRRLRVAAAEDGRRMTEVVREALSEWLDPPGDRPPRQGRPAASTT